VSLPVRIEPTSDKSVDRKVRLSRLIFGWFVALRIFAPFLGDSPVVPMHSPPSTFRKDALAYERISCLGRKPLV
jgi:hypothetical protein